jgi:hypothetical protein
VFLLFACASGSELIFLAEYWIDLGQNVAFQGRKLIECLRRIYEDVLKVWNFHDPDKVSTPHSDVPATSLLFHL